MFHLKQLLFYFKLLVISIANLFFKHTIYLQISQETYRDILSVPPAGQY